MSTDPDEEISEEERLAAIARLKKWAVGVCCLIIVIGFSLAVFWNHFLPKYQLNETLKAGEELMGVVGSKVWTEEDVKSVKRVYFGIGIWTAIKPSSAPHTAFDSLQLAFVDHDTKIAGSVLAEVRPISSPTASPGTLAFSLSPLKEAAELMEAGNFTGELILQSLKDDHVSITFSIPSRKIHETRRLKSILPVTLREDVRAWDHYHQALGRNVEKGPNEIAALVKSGKIWTDPESKGETRLAVGIDLYDHLMNTPPKSRVGRLGVAFLQKGKYIICIAEAEPTEKVNGHCVYNIRSWDDATKPPPPASYTGKLLVYSATDDSMDAEIEVPSRAVSERRKLRTIIPSSVMRSYNEWSSANGASYSNEATKATQLQKADVSPSPPVISNAVSPNTTSFDEAGAKTFLYSYFHLCGSSGGDAEKAMNYFSRTGDIWYYGNALSWEQIKRGSDSWDRKNPYRAYSIPSSTLRVKKYADGYYAAFRLNSKRGTSEASATETSNKCYVQIVEQRDSGPRITKIATCPENEDRPFPGWVIAQYKARISRPDIVLERVGIVWNLKAQGEAVIAREIVLQDRLNYFNDIRDENDEPCPWFSPEGASSMASLLQLRRKQLELMGTYFIGDRNRMFNGAADVEIQVKYQDRMTITILPAP